MTNATEPNASLEPLSDAYHKARRNLALFSGLLIAWEYVGFSVGDDGRGATAMVPGGVALKLKHPEVIPVVVLVLILYFAVRLAIEWYQCDKNRRRKRAAHWDVGLTYFFAGTAVSIFVLQQTIGFQVAAVLTPGVAMVPIIALGSIYLFYRYMVLWERLSKHEDMPRIPVVIAIAHIVPLTVGLTAAFTARHLVDPSALPLEERQAFLELTGDNTLTVFSFCIIAHGVWSAIFWKFYYKPRFGDLREFASAMIGVGGRRRAEPIKAPGE